jgi:hypothetical protein
MSLAVAQQPADDTYTERSALADILAWSLDRPNWQRDALRRLVQKGDLDSEDINLLVEICLDPAAAHEPLSENHVSPQSLVGEPVSLLGIANPTGINALVSDQILEFQPLGLTIIYGDNASGKSGYVRVLKNACRSRDRTTNILRDIEDTRNTPQTASIKFSRGQ